MHKFLGLEPPKKIAEKDTKEASRVYESTKRKRTIRESWKGEFAWLVTNDSIMYCQICRSVYGKLAVKRCTADKYTKYSKGPFVTGCTNLRHDGLLHHENSQGHQDALAVNKVKTATPSEKSSLPAAQIVKTLNVRSFERLKHLFTNAHALVKHSRPFTDFVWQCQADEKKGLDIGRTFHNKNSCKEFVVAIAEVARADIEAKIAQASFVSIMADGSTDISTVENEVVYIHFCIKGTVHCYFLGMMPCANGTALGIYDAIQGALKFEKLSSDDIKKKMVSYVGDGAAVNTGAEKGVIALFRRNVSSSIIMVKCLSHRVELAFKDALKKSKLFQDILQLLDLLFKFYHKSAKQTAGLKVSCENLGMPSVCFTRVGGTRWVGHTQTALKNFLKAYKPTLAHLSQVSICFS